jgi:cytidylate kinase
LEVRVDGEKVEMDGEDVSSAIREPGVNSVVSVIAAHGGVRDVMRGAQREWAAREGGGVVEGRDIGTVVFPDADVKIFLTASPMRRAARRVEQAGGDIHEVARSIEDRDRIDSTRQDSPLRPAEGSITVDSSDMTVDQVVEAIVRHYRDKCGEDN